MTFDEFRTWHPLTDLRLADLPQYGAIPAVYVMRRSRTGEIVYIGSTDNLRRSIPEQSLRILLTDRSPHPIHSWPSRKRRNTSTFWPLILSAGLIRNHRAAVCIRGPTREELG